MSKKSCIFARTFVKWGECILETTTTMNNEKQNIEYKESWRDGASRRSVTVLRLTESLCPGLRISAAVYE